MVIGGVVLPSLYTPIDCTYPRPERCTVVTPTYTGAAVFDGGGVLPGKVIDLKWTAMPKDLFDQLDAVYQAGGQIIWDSGINNHTYMVVMSALDGALLFDEAMNAKYLLNVTMKFIITSLIE